ncbi:MAG: 8-oxo-dGTP diphosphatase [Patescibacteria group bacterium]|nr:8-oxo-dGTP diphosphatase [Patescibacteria group bacterium]
MRSDASGVYYLYMRKAARAIVVHNQNILLMKRNKFGSIYYCLPGGGIDIGETADAAAVREIKEETNLIVTNPQLVYIEDAGVPYGIQYIFVCQYQDGDMKLQPDSIEAKLNEMGQNLFEPLWVPVSKFAGLPFRSKALQQELLVALRDGFPKEPKQIQSQAEISYTDVNNKEEEED